MKAKHLAAIGCSALLLTSVSTLSFASPPDHARAYGLDGLLQHLYDKIDRHYDKGWGHGHGRDRGKGRDHDRGRDHSRNNWVYEGVQTLELDRDIKHYTWELTVGSGPYDKIRAHRYVREPYNDEATPGYPAPDRRKVLFVINGTWGAEGDEPIREFDSFYFPDQGFDYWTLDFRTSYIPNMNYEQLEERQPEGLQTTADWTYEVFREDIKAAVEKAKSVSRADEVFMAGRSRGGTQMFMYAAKYADDLKGMIGLDGGPIYRGVDVPESRFTEEEFEAAMTGFREGEEGALLSEVGGYENGQLLGVLPYVEAQVGAPLPDESELDPPLEEGYEINDLLDLVAYQSYWTWGEGKVTNIFTPYPGGSGETYMSEEALRYGRSNYTRYWPAVQSFEASFLDGWANNPYLDLDDTHDVTVPVVYFVGELTCPGGSCVDVDRPYVVASDDVEINYLPGYGHLDVYYGTHSTEDVKKPMLDWMEERL